MSVTLTKRPGENALFDLDLSNRLPAGVNVASVVSVTSVTAGLTFGTPVFSGQRIQLTISGGTSGVVYEIKFSFTTASNPALEAIVYLAVDSKLL